MLSAASACMLLVTHIDTYRAAIFVVAMEMIKPTIPMPKDNDMCQKRSCVLSECLSLRSARTLICQVIHSPRPEK